MGWASGSCSSPLCLCPTPREFSVPYPCTHLSPVGQLLLQSLPPQPHPPQPHPCPTPADASAPLLQLCPLPLAALNYVLVLLGHFWGYRPACLPQGQDLEDTGGGGVGGVSPSEAAARPAPLSPAGLAPTFLSSRSWSKASTLRLCRGRADLQGREGAEGSGGCGGGPKGSGQRYRGQEISEGPQEVQRPGKSRSDAGGSGACLPSQHSGR